MSDAITPFDTVSAFIAEANRDELVRETGFAQQSISRAITENMMPASWYLIVREFCERRGIECPDHLFRWIDKRRTSDKPVRAAE